MDEQVRSAVKNARCLCKKPDGTVCGMVRKKTSIASHVYSHKDAEGNFLKGIALGVTHEWTDTASDVNIPHRTYNKKQTSLPVLTAQSGYVEMLVKVRVPINVGAAQIVNE
jgi:hypothetical protein